MVFLIRKSRVYAEKMNFKFENCVKICNTNYFIGGGVLRSVDLTNNQLTIHNTELMFSVLYGIRYDYYLLVGFMNAIYALETSECAERKTIIKTTLEPHIIGDIINIVLRF